ncbi:MAG TPA: efflux transporter outer membrane subunit [Caulobacteraceae bacterium]
MLRPQPRRHRAATATLLAAVLLSGCAAIPHINPKEHALESATLGLEGPRVAPEADWWRGLNDPQLDRIMGDALAGNPTLDVALARLRLAGAAVAVQHAGLLPQINIDGEESRERLSGAYIIPPPYAGTGRWVGSTQASLSWTLDFAGKQRALISQARHSADAAGLDVAAARIALTGAVAEAYVGLARAELQIRIAQSFVESRQESLALAHTRSTNNLDNDFDIRAAETLLSEAQKSLDKARGERAMMTHALAALAGRGADAYSGISAPTISLDAALPLPSSLPANLLDRRPDILAARARIEAANAGRKAAKADFYPTVDLRAFVGASAIGMGALLTSKALTGGGGPSVHIPVFEGGRLRAQYKASIAELDAATASFNALVLQAVQQAADALSAIDSTAAQAADQRKIEYGLTETVRLDKVRERTGLGTQLDILASGDQLLQARQTQADLDAESLTHRIQLLVAVGGDFNPSAPAKLAAADDRDASTKARP